MGADKRALKLVVRIVVIAAVAVALVVFVRRMDLSRAMKVLSEADPVWVVIGMVINGSFRIGTRVLRTRALLAALPGEVSLRELGRIIYGTVALGYLVSPVAGSAARVFALQRHGVPTEGVIAAQLWEKTVAGCALAAFAGPMLLYATPPAAHYALVLATVVGSVGIVVAIVVVAGFRRFQAGLEAASKSRLRRWFYHLGHSLSVLHEPRILFRAFVWSVLSELSDVLMLACALHALGDPIEPAACVLGYIAVNFSSAVPSTPGQLGVFEAAAAWALVAMDISPETALACGMLYHLIHVVPVLAIGVPSLLRLRAEERA